MGNPRHVKVYVSSGEGEGLTQWKNWWASEKTPDLMSGFASAPMLSLMKKVMPRVAPILEAGCGPGYFVHLMRESGFTMVGLDFVAEALVSGKEFDDTLPLFRAGVEQLPLKDNSLGGYFSGGVIEHFENGADKVVREAYRTLGEGGVMILTFPCMNGFRRLKSMFRRAPYRLGTLMAVKGNTSSQSFPGLDTSWVFHAHLYEMTTVESLLRQAGFGIEQRFRVSFLRGMKDIGIVGRLFSRIQTRHREKTKQGDATGAGPDFLHNRSVPVRKAFRLYDQLSQDRIPTILGPLLRRGLLGMFGHTAVVVCRKGAGCSEASH